MDRTPREPAAGHTSDGMLVAIPICAMLVPVGAIGPPIGLLLAVIGLLLAFSRAPSRNRTNLMVCSMMALVGTGVFTVAQFVGWLR